MYYVLTSKEFAACGSASASILRYFPKSESINRILQDIKEILPAIKRVEEALIDGSVNGDELIEELDDEFGYSDGYSEVSFVMSGSGLGVEIIVDINRDKLIQTSEIIAEEGETIARILATLYSVTMTLVHSFSRLNARLKKELM